MKRMLALALALLLAALPAAAETWAVSYGQPEGGTGVLLIRDDGTPLTRPEDYIELFALSVKGPARFGAARPVFYRPSENGEDAESSLSFAMLDEAGQPITGFDYTWLYALEGGAAVFFQASNGESGLMDLDGRELVRGSFNAYGGIAPCGDGAYLALASDSDEAAALLRVDADGAVTETGLHGGSLYAADTPGQPILLDNCPEQGGRSVFLDADGQPVFDAAFTCAYPFSHGYAVVQPVGSEEWGLIAPDGSFLMKSQYRDFRHLGPTDAGVILARGPGEAQLTLIDPRTWEVRRTMDFSAITGADYFACDDPGQALLVISIYDENSDQLRRLCYDFQGLPTFTGLDADGVEGYFNRQDGPAERLVARRGNNSRAEYWLVDLDGQRHGEVRQTIDCVLWQGGHGRFRTESYRFQAGDSDMIDWNSFRCGVCDEEGRDLLPARYNQVDVLSMDRFWVQDDRRAGLVDSDGCWLYVIDSYASLMD